MVSKKIRTFADRFFFKLRMMKKETKVLFISQEIDPYLSETEIANFCRKIPQYAQEHGTEIRVFMPCYGHINERRNQLHEVQRLSGVNIIINDNDHPLIMKVASIPTIRVQVYFIDNDDYFHRKGISGDAEGNKFDDNDERSLFFVRGVLETVKRMRWTPDIIHCTGWITALAPMFIKQSYITDPFFAKAKIIYTVCRERLVSPMLPELDGRMAFDRIKPNDYMDLACSPMLTSDNLDALAARYSDGIIAEIEEIPERVKRVIEERNLPVLEYEDATPGQRQYEFFKRVCPVFGEEIEEKKEE